MNSFVYQNPTELIFGKGEIAQLASRAAKLGKNVLVVYGGGSIKASGLYDTVMSILAEQGCQVSELAGVEPNPRLGTVYKGIKICRSENIDWILAVGGGSVVDAAKAIAVGALYDGDVWDIYSLKTISEDALPLGVVLTLAATGSEMNRSSVITNWETKEKFGGRTTFPAFSILDPVYTFTVPRDQTVNGICDMMSHVFEQYFSHTPEIPLQSRFAESILLTVIENAERVLDNPEDYDGRANLLLCGTMALNGTLPMGVTTDWASHAIEHAISAIYDIPHGAGLAIVLPRWMRYVYKENIARFKQYALRVWNVDGEGKTDEQIALAGIAQTEAFFKRIGAPGRLADYQIGDENLDRMARLATRFGSIGQFKTLGFDDVREILRACL